MEIYTIGHSNLPWELFLAALQVNDIQVVVDTRTSPYSRYVEWANRERLAAALATAGIGYRYAGVELGGKPNDPALRSADGNPDYDKIAASPAYERGIVGLLAAAD